MNELRPIFKMKNIDNYKVSIDLEYESGCYQPTISILDTGASFNIIHAARLPKGLEYGSNLDHYGYIRNLQDANGSISQNIATIFSNIKF
jgi:hypothetical protein